jgi:hypothetical protein
MPRTIGMPFACLALSCAGAAVAAEAPKPAEVVVVTTNAKPVCKSERSLSSRVVKRTCKTAAEWHRDSLDARNKLKLGAKSQTTEAFKRPTSP